MLPEANAPRPTLSQEQTFHPFQELGGDLASSSQGAWGSSPSSPGLASSPGSPLAALWGAGLMSGVGEGCRGEQPGATA